MVARSTAAIILYIAMIQTMEVRHNIAVGKLLLATCQLWVPCAPTRLPGYVTSVTIGVSSALPSYPDTYMVLVQFNSRIDDALKQEYLDELLVLR